MSRILIVVTGSDHWTLADGTKHPTGYWAEEVTAPYAVLRAASHQIVFATPGGVVPTVDAGSLSPDVNGGQENADRIAAELAAISELRSPLRLEDIDPSDPDAFDAVFYAGGHGPMEDLSVHAASGRLLNSVLASGRPVSVVCHGPAALLATVGEDGTSPSPDTGRPGSPTPRRPRPASPTGPSGCSRTGWWSSASTSRRARSSLPTSSPTAT